MRWEGGPGRMVFMPGTGLTVETYAEALAGLAGVATVHGLNIRGHGGSTVPDGVPSWQVYVDDLAAFMAETFPTPPVVAGHSLGALLSIWLAAQAPEKVPALLLLDPVMPLGSKEDLTPQEQLRFSRFLNAAKKRRDRWASRAEAEQQLRGRGGYEGWREGPFQAFLDWGLRPTGEGEQVELACPPWLEAGIYEGRVYQPLWDWIRACRAPTVVVRGAESPVSASHAVEELAEIIPVATVLTVKGEHAFAQTNPEGAAEALKMAWDILAGQMAKKAPAE